MKLILAIYCLLLFQVNCVAQENMNCREYKNGFFVYEDKHDNTVIYRKKGRQIEYDRVNGTWVTISIHWISECKYYFKYLATTKNYLTECIGKSMVVTITAVNESGYHYSAIYNHGEKNFVGEIVRPIAPLNRELKRKIRKKLKQTS